ncbi:MAG: CHY zinc finger protein [Bacteroidota bacterium]
MNIIVKGKTVDQHTRCVHYHSPLDIIAIKFKCCGTYYPCFYCHAEETDHPAMVWKKTEFDTNAVLCGNCSKEITIDQYLSCNYHCQHCQSPFNPRCINHNHLYFEQ